VLDQSLEILTGGTVNGTGYDDYALGQSFTVGLTGTLSRIEVPLQPNLSPIDPGAIGAPPYLINLSIVPFHNGEADINPGDELAKAQISIPNAIFEPLYSAAYPVNDYQWVPFDIPGIAVNAGDRLAIILKSKANDFVWAEDDRNGYSAGQFYFGRSFEDSGTTFDFLFRTFVSPIPEPTSAALIAFAAMIFRMQRSRTRI
jgi:hypothetical protein